MGRNERSAGQLQPSPGKESFFQRLRAQLGSFWDTDLAIGGAVVATILGLAEVTSVKTTVALTLAVLAAVAGALHRDRRLREGLRESIGELDSRLSSVSRAHSNPLPFDVLSARYRWEFDAAGNAAVSKQARVRFVHNGVWTILAWHGNIQSIESASARRVFKNGGTHELPIFGDLDMGDGKQGKLIGLDRRYRQNQVMEYEYSFESRGTFTGTQEWLNIAIETFTADFTIELAWPKDRLPSLVWLDIDGEPDLEITDLESSTVTVLKYENLEADRNIPVRWLWNAGSSTPPK